MYDIFISYRTTHADWVETLAHNLQAQDYSIFLDRWELIAGQHFPDQIYQALRNARCAILVATPDASDSGWVQQELQLMISMQSSGSDFFYVPIVLGEFPDLPFVETVQAVDFGDSHPQRYRQAFQHLLCGLQQQPPGPDPVFEGELRLPKIDTADKRPLVQSEQTFVEQVFTRLETGLPLMILAQADTNTQIYGRALRQQAEALYGADNVFHLFPPNSSRADSAAYFGRLARQCHLEGDITESWQWAEALLSQKLDSGQDVFLLVTGFENGPQESRA
ncbi:MAG: toll/interleukin-1 receptor domain-containing protein, partial [bacterium]|nr:toll/interleukin-1 receptor domain-containing protein [bacterium]